VLSGGAGDPPSKESYQLSIKFVFSEIGLTGTGQNAQSVKAQEEEEEAVSFRSITSIERSASSLNESTIDVC
jgi:hypothetical protein